MKPLKLTMSAFGSYGKETVIDFTTADHGLFLITGDTGSGKTTIFDGITFAIYGETSGGKRDGKMMRSQFASPSDETFVELMFSYRGETYTVRRTPEYLREKKRGSGLVKAAATVELTMPDGTAFRGKLKETDKKLCEIMGIDREQFIQIAMIAQGDFLRLLHAKSEDRKKIFSTIFHTGLYRKVEEELGEKRKEQKSKIEGTGERIKAYVQSVEVPCLYVEDGETEQRECLDAATEKLDQLKEEEQPDLGTLREILEAFLVSDRENLEKIELPLGEAERTYGQLRERRGIAKGNNDAIDAYQRAGVSYEEKLKLEAAYMEQRKQLQQAEQAFQVTPFFERVRQNERQLIEAIRGEREAGARLEHAFQAVNEAMSGLISPDNMQELKNTLHDPDNQKLTFWISEWKTEERVLEAAGRKMKELLSRETAVLRKEHTFQKRREELEKHLGALTLAREHYGKLQEQFFREQAGILAKERLLPGHPCPVCGSLEHPQPAVLSAEAVTEQQVKEARDMWDRMRNQCEAMTLEVREMQMRMEEEKRQIAAEKKEIPKEYEKRLYAIRNMIDIVAHFVEKKERFRKAEETLVHCKGAVTEAASEYESARTEAGFESEESYLDAGSKWKTRAQLLAVKKENEQYFLELRESKTTLETLQQQVKGKEYIDLSVLDLELEQWSKEREFRNVQKEQFLRMLKNHERLLATVEREEKEYTGLLKTFLLYDGLWQAAGGKLKGKVRLDFETYVQRMYFERIIAAANKRFLVFTNGKMKLKSRPLEDVGLVGAAGLELNVYVMATGKERDVKTLSGGESFLASLALALGLSDVVQSQAGSVHLESMFVDEGFGALDDTTREQAMRVLNDLAGDDRLVGIISHVNTLKDSIERKLLVKRTLQGSTISWN